jgi:hypothetical protein
MNSNDHDWLYRYELKLNKARRLMDHLSDTFILINDFFAVTL